jgi:preprotein translocase subunit SecA
MLQNFVKIFGGDPNKREIEKLSELVEVINGLEPEFESLSDEALRAKTDEFRARLPHPIPFAEHPRGALTGRGAEGEGIEDDEERFKAEQEILEEILPEAYAAVREASKRTIGLRHFDVQMIGGIALHRSSIAEMKTGEGKTLVATLPLYLNALTGRGTHLITVNDYLARRDARWMAPIYNFLGLSVGVLQMAAVTENGKKAFLVDLDKQSPHEDQHQLRMVDRAEAYRADVTYGTNSEFGFDYLRDNMTMRLDARVQRGHHYAIVDEVDNVLIDEARTPLIISGPASGDLEWYGKMAQTVKQLKSEDYEVSEKDRTVSLTEIGIAHVEQLLGQPLQDPDRPEDVTPEQARLLGYLEQALRAQHLFKRNKDYLVQAGKVIIVDEFTGRLMPGRRWSDGLHQAVEAKEGVRVEPESVTYATITIQNYFRMYRKLAGMTGTALTEAEEFNKIYKLEVTPIPTNLEFQAFGDKPTLVERKAKDEDGYQYTYYVRAEPPSPPSPLPEGEGRRGEGGVVLWKRKDYPDIIYRTVEAKLRAIVKEIVRYHVMGRPMLVGTTSVESSDRLSGRLRAEPVRRLMQILLVRQIWLRANDRIEDGRLIEEFVPFNGPLEEINPGQLRKFAQPLGVTSINPEDDENLPVLLDILRLGPEYVERLTSALKAGVPHQVLNARKHTEESQIIAGAGAFGAVTIATNMAGRGVDIKLGGELAEEEFMAVNRVLRRIGVDDPYEMPLEERRQALLKANPEAFGIYDGEVKHFLGYFDDMERVKALGGLHVIGSERHEARRIDNQLRGRAARQGDPGSSRFFLSLEDDLMRLFAGQQVSSLMERLRVDDSLPLESRLVSNIVEQSQHRVEGANFDVRKHLLEYDDVLNSQRARIYSQRDRIFVKEDLSEDVNEMLQTEIEMRVPVGLADEEGPWKLMAWLEQVQPPFAYGDDRIFPSFGLRLLLEELNSSDDIRSATLTLVSQAIEAEQAHTLRAISALLERTADGLDQQLEERSDALDTFFEGLRDSEEQRHPKEAVEELQSIVRLPLKLSNNQMRLLANEPEEIEDDIKDLLTAQLTALYATRVIGAVENRLNEPLGIDKSELQTLDWDELSTTILDTSEEIMRKQRERLVGENGQILRDLDAALQREPADNDDAKLRLLLALSKGLRTAFDSKTHRQVKQAFNRFSYVFLTAGYLQDRPEEEVIEEVLEHLAEAEDALVLAWGQGELMKRSEASLPLPPLQGDRGMQGGQDEAKAREVGRQVLNQVHRQLLLQAITEQWVDYLTRVEALRVSVGLEAYAQRDPLVQYKSQASEMFQGLLADIRSLVISRVFAYQPRRIQLTLTEPSESPSTGSGQRPAPMPAQTKVQTGPEGKNKKKRKRHKK